MLQFRAYQDLAVAMGVQHCCTQVQHCRTHMHQSDQQERFHSKTYMKDNISSINMKYAAAHKHIHVHIRYR
jgi:hypothetical protein